MSPPLFVVPKELNVVDATAAAFHFEKPLLTFDLYVDFRVSSFPLSVLTNL